MADISLSQGAALLKNAPATSRDNAAGETKEEDPNRPANSVTSSSSKHWRKLRAAVKALAAFRSRKVKASDFERMRMCGEGGSGLVYLVRLKSTSLYFALKVQLKQDLQSKERRVRRALIEREVLVTCAHPFVCNLYTAFQDSRHLYLLMDFCAGGDLASFIRNVVRRPLTEREARFYSSEIVAALEWIHLHGFVYRDLKPENVLVHESGHIRLGDFGTAERGSARKSQTIEKVSREEVESAFSEGNGGSVGICAEELDLGPAFRPSDTTDVLSSGGTQSRTRSSDHSSREGDQSLAVAGDPGERVQLGRRLCTVSVNVDPVLENGPGAGEATSHTVDNTLVNDTINGGREAPAHDPSPPLPPSESKPQGFLRRDASWGVEPFSVGCLCSRPKTDNKPRRGFQSVRNMPKQESSKRRIRRTFQHKLGVTSMRRILKLETPPKTVSLPKDNRPEEGKNKVEDEKFCKGRGSVKLNVLLDSQTFIGTADFMSPEMVTGKERQGAAMDWWALGVMVYEMTLGVLPFNSHLVETDEGLFRSIVNTDVSFPPGHYLSDAAVDFIRELLRKDPSERLGERHGVGEIKRHPFFKDVHWALIASRDPPFPVWGPDTPGWLDSIGHVPAEDKMASWTWQHTTDAERPQVVDEQDAESSSSPKGRTCFSLCESEVGSRKLNSDGVASTRFEEGTAPGVVGENGVRVKMFISRDSDDEQPGEAGSDTGKGCDDETKEAEQGGRKCRRHGSNNFDGYDFNTTHKVGSFVLGRGSDHSQRLGSRAPSSGSQSKRSSSDPQASDWRRV